MEGAFTFMGMSVTNLAKLFGAILVAWGIMAYFMQSADPPSITAMIPAFMGLPLLSLGLLADWNESNSHHYMHAAMVFALLMVLGGAQGLIDIDGKSNLAIGSHLILALLGIIFMVAGIMSFRHARKLRESSGV
ncbi:MAG TPA: hypothetical protein HA315_04895 [Candidatus Thalassarchaeaceae archaeon]|jgi:peptidoglycan/LPS O-acetylase OafA/YrhL|nr:hypothetical protein [Euryarchaeota archaeon]DAC42743.1 MAG TPA: hypothetical protein D7H72_04885 [Candidatus Poseidoniales archaeon]HII35317.1 hypothetical protein [Candidatus Thalassarchaeaceae archaeon]|tara:strand:+ start:10039 stop:10440 length:402 start_codon:yes stop_codon:yes gene_type:complete